MNKLLTLFYVSMILISSVSCKKKHFEHQSIDFLFADSIAGTYVGTRFVFDGPWTYTTSPPTTDTISVQVIDKRTDKICKFYIECFDEEIILLESKRFKTSWRYAYDAGDFELAQEYVDKCCFSGDTLFYVENYSDKINDFTRYRLVLIKQP